MVEHEDWTFDETRHFDEEFAAEATQDMADYDSEFDRPPTDEEMERQFIVLAQLTPPAMRTKEQWSALGFPMGPPIYAREDEA